jgi:aminopeptidase N
VIFASNRLRRGIEAVGAKGAIALQELEGSRVRPRLKEIVVEASRALAHLDAGRLEELALSCQALNRDLVEVDSEARDAFAIECQEAVGDMAVFTRVLEATRANLHVMNRLRELREGRLEYGRPQAQPWRPAGGVHGNN